MSVMLQECNCVLLYMHFYLPAKVAALMEQFKHLLWKASKDHSNVCRIILFPLRSSPFPLPCLVYVCLSVGYGIYICGAIQSVV